MNTNTVKIILAVLLFSCLFNWEYGYYQFVRFLALIGFSYLAYQVKDTESQTEMYIYIAMAILFQPLFKISLGRSLWNIVDVIVGAGLLLSLINKPKVSNE